MRILITGAGMVGCYTARELLKRGDQVTLFDIAPRDEYIRAIARGDAAVSRGDLSELPQVIEAILNAKPEVVIHTGGLIGGAAEQAPYRGFRVNVDGTINVAEAVRLAGVRRLIFASSLNVNDLSHPQNGPLTEEFPAGGDHVHVYGASKVAGEQILKAYARHYGFELAALRFAGVYGYGHYAGGSGIGRNMLEMVKAVLEGRPAPLRARIAETDEMVYVKDVAQGVALATHAQKLPHQVYNIGSGAIVTADDLARAFQRVVPGAKAERVEAPRPEPPRLQPLDLSRSRAELGYEPRFDLEAGLRDFIEEYKRTEGQ